MPKRHKRAPHQGDLAVLQLQDPDSEFVTYAVTLVSATKNGRITAVQDPRYSSSVPIQQPVDVMAGLQAIHHMDKHRVDVQAALEAARRYTFPGGGPRNYPSLRAVQEALRPFTYAVAA